MESGLTDAPPVYFAMSGKLEKGINNNKVTQKTQEVLPTKVVYEVVIFSLIFMGKEFKTTESY